MCHFFTNEELFIALRYRLDHDFGNRGTGLIHVYYYYYYYYINTIYLFIYFYIAQLAVRTKKKINKFKKKIRNNSIISSRYW